MYNKKCMSKEENIEFAKSKLVDFIYSYIKMEGINITIDDVSSCISGKVGDISKDVLIKINNLKDSWYYIFSHIDDELSVKFIRKMYYKVCKNLNIKLVYVTGKSFLIRLEKFIHRYKKDCGQLNKIMEISDDLERCVNLFCSCQKYPIYLEENKKVASMIANKEMIKNGLGLILIPENKVDEYNIKLLRYYDCDDINELKNFIYDYCIISK